MQGSDCDGGEEFMSCEEAGEAAGCETVAARLRQRAEATSDLFQKYGVDVYNAGHSHLYAVTWPMLKGSSTQRDYRAPKGTVYITEGNGAVPGTPAATKCAGSALHPRRCCCPCPRHGLRRSAAEES